jgi:serine/threonine-protein kinase
MVGTVLGNYRILQKLGEGGMGVVYLGRHEALGHAVAVKVLQPALSRDATMVKRFFTEAQAATSIRSPGIVQIFDFGTSPDGAAYFVMELLEGVPLSRRLAERRLDYGECCRIGRQVANALHAAHQCGITHRDLKPDNLFLVPDPDVAGGERVKVLDFGIAKLATEAQGPAAVTQAGLVLGTPSYMAPEQCRGAGAIDARADIYSLGCILYEMACGHPPFVAAGAGEVLGAHQFLPPPMPQTRAPDIPQSLAVLLLHMLAKSPDLRPSTMAAVAQALDDVHRAIGPGARSIVSPGSGEHGSSSASSVAPTGPYADRHLESGPRGQLAPGPHAATTLGSAASMVMLPAPPRAGAARGGGSPSRGRALRGAAIGVAAGALASVIAALVIDRGGDRETSSRAGATAVALPAPTPGGAAQRASEELARECDAHQTVRDWGKLAECAAQLRERMPERAAAWAGVAAQGLERAAAASATVREARAAIAAGELVRAGELLEAAGPAATGHAEAVAAHAAAEAAAVTALVPQLRRVRTPDCKAHARALDAARGKLAAAAVARAEEQVPCAACSASAIADRAAREAAAGKRSAALRTYDEAYRCRPDPVLLRRAFLVACAMQSRSQVRAYWARLAPADRAAAFPACAREGFTRAELDAP